jgi:hypothetical protein
MPLFAEPSAAPAEVASRSTSPGPQWMPISLSRAGPRLSYRIISMFQIRKTHTKPTNSKRRRVKVRTRGGGNLCGVSQHHHAVVVQFEFSGFLTSVIPSGAVFEAERGISLGPAVFARSLGPLMKARAFGMTPL